MPATSQNTTQRHTPDQRSNYAKWHCLLAWLQQLALDGDLARAEPKTLRYRVLHAAGRLVRGGRRRTLRIPATWPWAAAIAAAWKQIATLPQAP
jgi:Transposase DDE domain group 1